MKKDNKNRNLQKGERQLKSGRYEYRYTDTTGKQRSVYSWKLTASDPIPSGKKDELSLRELEQDIREAIENHTDIHRANRVTFGEMFERMNSLREVKPTTRATREYQYKNWIGPALGKKKIADITYYDVAALCRDMSVRHKLRAASINQILIMIKMTLELAVIDCLIDKNPARLVKAPRNTTHPKEALTIEEQNDLLDLLASKPHKTMYRMTLIMLHTGVRIGELLALTWKDVDFKKQVLHVNKNISFVRKSIVGKDTPYVISTPKTNAGVRDIPLTAPALETFREMYMEQTIKGFCNFGIDGVSGFIFFTSGDKPITRQYVAAEYRRIIQAYNERHPENPMPAVHPHLLRHTFITRMIESGAAPKTVSVIAGHTNVHITLDVYTSVTKDTINDSVRNFDEYMRESRAM